MRKLRGGLMPPPGNPRPDQREIEAFVAATEHAIDRGAPAHAAGHVPVQRLNRTEYAASVKALLGVEIDAKQYLPNEIEVDGFDNIAAALSVSPAFLEQYIGVARKVARLAVGEATPKLQSAYFPPPAGDQDNYVDGMPLGTRGGTSFKHPFPSDGEYRFTITDLDVGLYPRALETEQTLVMLLDRNEVFRAKLGGREDLALVDHGGAPARAEIMQRFASIPVHVTAGVHEVIVTFIERARASTDEPIAGFTPYGGFSFTGQMRVPRVIGGIEVKGPFDPTGVSRTVSRAKLFVCEPETADKERACAERITANLARRAYRRPVTNDDVERLMPFYEAGRRDGAAFDSGIEQMVTAVLASPDFLYRAIAPPHARGRRGIVRARRPRARVAPVVLPLEPGSRRRAPRARVRGQAARDEAARGAGSSACSPIRARARSSPTSHSSGSTSTSSNPSIRTSACSRNSATSSARTSRPRCRCS